jgi:hypothetical protein
MDALRNDRKRLDNRALQSRDSLAERHATSRVDHHFLSHRSVAVEAENLLLSAVVRPASSTSSTTGVSTSSHWDDANFVTDFETILAFGVGAKGNNSATAFMANRARPIDP